MEGVWDLSKISIPQGEEVRDWIDSECQERFQIVNSWLKEKMKETAENFESLEMKLQELFCDNCLTETDMENFVLLKRINGATKILEEQRFRFLCVLGSTPVLSSPYCLDIAERAANGQLRCQLGVRFFVKRERVPRVDPDANALTLSFMEPEVREFFNFGLTPLGTFEKESLDIVFLAEDFKFCQKQRVKIFDLVKNVRNQVMSGECTIFDPQFVYDVAEGWGGLQAVSEELVGASPKLQSMNKVEFVKNVFLYAHALLNTSVCLDDTCIFMLRTKKFIEVCIVYLAPSFFSSFGTSFPFLMKFIQSKGFQAELNATFIGKGTGIIPVFSATFPICDGRLEFAAPMSQTSFEVSRYFHGKLHVLGMQSHIVVRKDELVKMRPRQILSLTDAQNFYEACGRDNERQVVRGKTRKVHFFELVNVSQEKEGFFDNYFSFTNFEEHGQKIKKRQVLLEKEFEKMEIDETEVEENKAAEFDVRVNEGGTRVRLLFKRENETVLPHSGVRRRIMPIFEKCDALCVFSTHIGQVGLLYRISIIPLQPGIDVTHEMTLCVSSKDNGEAKSVVLVFPNGVPNRSVLLVPDFFNNDNVLCVNNPFYVGEKNSDKLMY